MTQQESGTDENHNRYTSPVRKWIKKACLGHSLMLWTMERVQTTITWPEEFTISRSTTDIQVQWGKSSQEGKDIWCMQAWWPESGYNLYCIDYTIYHTLVPRAVAPQSPRNFPPNKSNQYKQDAAKTNKIRPSQEISSQPCPNIDSEKRANSWGVHHA